MHKEDDVKENIDVLPLNTHKLSRFSNKSIDYAQKMYKAFGNNQRKRKYKFCNKWQNKCKNRHIFCLNGVL